MFAKQVTSPQKEFPPKTNSFRAANIGISLILIATLCAVLIGARTFQTYLTIDDLLTINTEKMSVWREIDDKVDYIFDIAQQKAVDDYGMLVPRLQLQLHTLLAESNTLHDRYYQALGRLERFNQPLLHISAIEFAGLRQNIRPLIINSVKEVSEAPLAVVRAEFRHWSTSAKLTFHGMHLYDTLTERREILVDLKSRSTLKMWRLLGFLVAVLFLVTSFVWLALLLPAAKSLTAARRDMDMLLSTIPAHVASYSRSGHLQSANRAYLNKWGNPPLKTHVTEVIGAEFWQSVQTSFQRALDGEIIDFDIALDCDGGKRMHHVQYTPFTDEKGQISLVIVMVTDVQDRYDHERALRENKERLRITLDSIGDAVVSTDVNGIIEHMNPVACALTGWTLDQATGHPLGNIVRIYDRTTGKPFNDLVSQVVKARCVFDPKTHSTLMSRNGQEFTIKHSAAPIFSDDKNIDGVVLVFRDTTEELALNERVTRGEKMRAIGQLAGGIAHDINNNLAIIRGYSELLSIAPHDSETFDKNLKQIIFTCDNAASLIKKMTAFSRKDTSHNHATNIRDLITATLDILRDTTDRRVELSFECRAKNTMVNGNADMLQSVFMNIGLNALQAMDGTGTFHVTLKEVVLRTVERFRPHAFDLPPGKYLNIEFRDNGPGIPQKNLARIFEPYFSTKNPNAGIGGSGLGLSVVYGVIDEHKGAVYAENAPQGGALITIKLPLMGCRTDQPGKPLIAKLEKPSIPLRILMVEDELALREIGSKMLKEIGCHPHLAEHGEAALEIYRKERSHFDLVILDLNMPRMSGLEVLTELRKINPQVRTIIATGFAAEVYQQAASDPAIFSILRKPYSFSDLTAVIKQFSETLEAR